MPYSTDSDLYARLSESQVQRLTDEEGTGQVDAQLVSRLRQEQTDYIDAWLRGRHDLPLPEPVPPLLSSLEVSLLAARLYSRRPNVETPEGVETERKAAVRDLKDIARGKIDLGIEEPEGDGSGGDSYRSRSEPATLSEKLRRY